LSYRGTISSKLEISQRLTCLRLPLPNKLPE